MTQDSKSGLDRRQLLAAGGALAASTAMPYIARAQANEVMIGALLPLTGPSAGFGQVSWEGLRFACEMVNEAGGIKSMNGAKLTPVIGDTESKPEVAAAQAEQLIRRGARVLVGCNQSPATIVASQVAERQSIPFICAYDIDPSLTARGFKYLFRVTPLITNYAEDLMTFMKDLSVQKGQPITKVGLLSENSIAGQGANKLAAAAAEKLGLAVVDASTYTAGTTQNFAPYVTKLRSAGAEGVIGHNRISEGIAIIRTMMELKYNPKFIGGILGAPNTREFMEALGPNSDHIYSTDAWSLTLNIPGMQEVAERNVKQFGKPMDPSTATMFSDVAVITDALERAKTSDPKALRDAIAATELKIGERRFFMLRGVKFGPTGENERAGSLIGMCRDQKAVAVWPPEVAAFPASYPKPNWI